MKSESTVSPPRINSLVFFKISLLTFLFGSLYFILRSLPDAQCGFLHYEEIVHPDGTIEYCATNHAGFLDLTLLKYPVDLNLSMDDRIQANEEQEIALELLTPGGMTIAPHELAVTHTKKMHVMLIDPSLIDYHHIHPRPEGNNGKYTFKFKPKKSGAYTMFTEIVPLRTRRQVIATGTIDVAGLEDKALFKRQLLSDVDSVRFELKGVPETLRTGTDYRFDLSVLNAEGKAVDLEMVMGAKGHMVAFDAERKGFAHMHPIDEGLSSMIENRDPGLAFLFNVPNPGWYRLFAQIKVDGREVFGSFDLKVE